MARHRVGMGKSFVMATAASLQAPGSVWPTWFFASIAFGFWWWITGVPELAYRRWEETEAERAERENREAGHQH